MPNLPTHVPINAYRTPCAEKNDKLGWKDGCSFEFDGFSIGLRSNDPEFITQLRQCLPSHAQASCKREVDVLLSFIKGGQSERKGTVNYHIVYDGWDRVARTLDLDEALLAFNLTMKYKAAQFSKTRLYLAAAVFGWANQALLVTEANDECIRSLSLAGAELISSDFALIDDSNRVSAWTGETYPLNAIIFNEPQSRNILKMVSSGTSAMRLVRNAPGVHLQAGEVLRRTASLCNSFRGYRATLTTAEQGRRLLKSVAAAK